MDSFGFLLHWIHIQPRYGNYSASEVTTVFAREELILAAGLIGTLLVLQGSRVGLKSLLQKANIDVKVYLPGVGQNLQDHSVIAVRYNCKQIHLGKEHIS
jgi:choline dehydrogenase